MADVLSGDGGFADAAWRAEFLFLYPQG